MYSFVHSLLRLLICLRMSVWMWNLRCCAISESLVAALILHDWPTVVKFYRCSYVCTYGDYITVHPVFAVVSLVIVVNIVKSVLFKGWDAIILYFDLSQCL